ncbi:type II secretion system F family protein [bacterium]|nr:type II secretion system F family protein [bacterium]
MERVFLYRQLGVMLNSGVPIVRALEAAAEMCVSSRRKRVWIEVGRAVSEGSVLSQACSAWPEDFSLLEIGIMQAGESSCSLAELLIHLGDLYEFELNLKRRLKAALQYPIILILAMLSLMILTVTHVFPAFVPIFESSSQELPILTKLLIAAVSLLRSGWFIKLLFVCSAVLLISVKFYFMTPQSVWTLQKYVLTLPVIGNLAKAVVMARFCRVLALMVKSGLSLVSALHLTGMSLANYPLAQALEETAAELKEGGDLPEAMQLSGYFSVKFIAAMRVASESSSLEAMLKNLSKVYNEQSRCSIDSLYSCLEPAILTVMGGFIGLVLLGLFLPLYSCINNIG